MVSKVKRLRNEASAAERAGNVGLAQQLRAEASAVLLKQQRAAARNARAVKARTPRTENRGPYGLDTFVGRIDARLDAIGKTRKQLEAEIPVSRSYLASLGRKGWKMGPIKMVKAARILGCSAYWLKHGGDDIHAQAPSANGEAPALLVPTATTVFKANGKAPAAPQAARAHTALNEHLDAAMMTLWGTMPPDVKAFLLARIAELVVMKGRTHS